MSFDQKKHSVIKLGFYPNTGWPKTWPAFVWQGVQLTPPNAETIVAPVHFPESYLLEELIFQIYPKLAWIELWHLTAELQRLQIPFQSEKLWQLYGFRESDENEKWQSIFAQVPTAAMAWWVDKEFGPRDLAPLKALPQVSSLRNELEVLARLQMSKTEGQKALEWLIELYLLGNTHLPVIFQNIENGSQLLERLEELRFPLVAKKKKQSEDLLKRLSWPRRLQARVSRVGDLSGFEIKFFVHNRDEFVKHVEGLQLVARQLDDDAVEKF